MIDLGDWDAPQYREKAGRVEISIGEYEELKRDAALWRNLRAKNRKRQREYQRKKRGINV